MSPGLPRVSTARLALHSGALDAERVLAMLRVRRYALHRMHLCESLLELEVAADTQAATDLLGPRLQRLVGVELLGPVSHAGDAQSD